jgi:hypothetical protein
MYFIESMAAVMIPALLPLAYGKYSVPFSVSRKTAAREA